MVLGMLTGCQPVPPFLKYQEPSEPSIPLLQSLLSNPGSRRNVVNQDTSLTRGMSPLVIGTHVGRVVGVGGGLFAQGELHSSHIPMDTRCV